MTTITLPYVADSNGLYSFSLITPNQIIELATSIMEGRVIGEALTSPEDTKRFLSLKIGHLEHEVFCCLFLDNRHRVISFDHMFNGTIDGASVYPREVVKAALKHNAAAVIFTHNHPSGEPEPSQTDQRLTERLKNALALVDIRVLDHLVIGGSSSVSFAERGLI